MRAPFHRWLGGVLLGILLSACAAQPAAAGPFGFGFRHKTQTIVAQPGTSTSPLRLDVNLPVSDWWAYAPPLVDTVGGDYVTGQTSSNPIPDANRDAQGNVKSLPGGEAAASFVSHLPATAAQRKLTWSCTGAPPCVATLTANNATSPTYNLASNNVTYTPIDVLGPAGASEPYFRYTPTSSLNYPTNFQDRPVADPGGTTSALFNSLIAADTSSSRIIRYMDATSVNRNNSPIWQGSSAQPATSVAGKTISSITFVGTTATVTTSTAHGLLGNGTGSASASVTVTGATPATYNVADVYIKAISPTQFQYTMAGTPTGNATVVGSYAVGDNDFQFTDLHYPSVGSEPGTQFTEPIYVSANRNKNNADIHWHDGKPIETLASTAAGASASAWYTAPPNADSTFYTDAATVWASFAATNNRDVYVEVGNEPWNSGFKWFHQLRNEANLRGTLGDALTACRLVATSNIGLSGLAAIDGITPIAGDRILVPAQSTASQNGVYVAAAGAWSRAADTLAFRDIWLVNSGLTSANTSWFVSTTGAIVAGTTPLTITQIANQHRYAEKVIEVANPFIAAFASAGASAHLHIVAAWQNAGTTANWSTMQAFLPSSDWAKITELAVAPYYGDEGDSALVSAGITSGYTGSTATLKAAISSDIDAVVASAAGHQVAAQALGKKLIFYEGGNTIVLSNIPYKSAFERSSDAYDLELRFLQQLELKVASKQTGGLDLASYSLVYPLGADSFSWGQVEYLSQALSKATTPKLWAHTDFRNGVRVLSDVTGAFTIPFGAVNGTVVGTTSQSAFGSAFSLSNSSGGLFGINASTGVVTVANAGLITLGNSYPLSILEAYGAANHTTTFSVPAAGNGTAYRYYRLLWQASFADPNAGAATVNLAETLGGPDTAAGQTYADSDHFSPSYTGANLFDGNVATEYASNGSAMPHWVSVDYGPTAGNWKKINQITIVARAGGASGQAPTQFKLQASTDNFVTSIVDIMTKTTPNWLVDNESRTFTP